MTQTELSFDTPRATGQCADILQYMAEFGGITALDAMRDLGCMRLASRILDLRRLGYAITADRITVKNRWNDDCNVTQYRRG